MVNYTTRKPLKTFPNDFNFEAYKANVEREEQQNMEKYKEAMGRYRAIVKEVKDIYGQRSNVYQYMRRNPPPKPTGFSSIIRRTKENYDKHLERQRQREQGKAYRQRRKELIQRLTEKGLVADVDFPANKVVTWWKANVVEIEGEIYFKKDSQDV